MMILWTIQAEGAWQRAQKTGLLRTDGRNQWHHFREAYRWMQREMHRRVGAPPRGVRHPIWAWLQYENAEKKRPDLRLTGHLPAGSRGVLIEFNASEDQLLLSDFELWHYALNRWYLPQTSNEVKDDIEDALPAFSEVELTSSWQRIFDLDWYLEGVSVPRLKRSIQATIWQVPLGSVRSVTTFCAR